MKKRFKIKSKSSQVADLTAYHLIYVHLTIWSLLNLTFLLAVLYLVDHLKKRGLECQEVRGYFVDGFGGFSGGTIASLRDMWEP